MAEYFSSADYFHSDRPGSVSTLIFAARLCRFSLDESSSRFDVLYDNNERDEDEAEDVPV